MATISTSITQQIYQIGTRALVDVAELSFQQILCQVDTYDINIPICFPRLITGLFLSHHPKVITDDEMAVPTPKMLTLNYKLFHRLHVSTVLATFQPPRRSLSSSGANLSILAAGLHFSQELAMRVAELYIRLAQGLWLFLSHHPKVITDDEMAVPTPKMLTLNYKLFHELHVSTVLATFQPPRWSLSSSDANLSILTAGLLLSQELAMRVVQLVQLMLEESRLHNVSLKQIQELPLRNPQILEFYLFSFKEEYIAEGRGEV
ncbi:envelope-like [Cucumis melo var. makuwa]|uniref:Envelope-like n=1 Tax=Cucumis melo var. makuwa TaxID=1194695 RepID=A0A5D3DUS2_CUCMM|nr:envelope-like [Cucumis melo var. makuwa]